MDKKDYDDLFYRCIRQFLVFGLTGAGFWFLAARFCAETPTFNAVATAVTLAVSIMFLGFAIWVSRVRASKFHFER